MAKPLMYCYTIKHPDTDQWQKAIEKEIEAHAWNGTWKIVPLSKGCKVIGFCWVFKIKHNMNGSVKCYKAYLIAKGFS